MVINMTGSYDVLFLCTGNSAHSIMAEAIMNRRGQGRFVAYSAGSHPADRVNPDALAQIKRAGLPTESLRSQSWDEFSRPDSPRMDFVSTVCDQVVGGECPVWPGQPITAPGSGGVHWRRSHPGQGHEPGVSSTDATH